MVKKTDIRNEDAKVIVIPFKCSRRMKEELKHAFSGKYTSMSEGIRGILQEWLENAPTKARGDAKNG
jgi:hypothetical protein